MIATILITTHLVILTEQMINIAVIIQLMELLAMIEENLRLHHLIQKLLTKLMHTNLSLTFKI